MPRWLGLAPAHSRNCRAESLSQSILETSAPPNSANWNWSAQSGIQSGDASSATLARAALCACRSCPSLDATSAPGETQRLSGAETSATPDADADRDIHQSPCHSTPAVPQTSWWCHCACSRAPSYRAGIFSAAARSAPATGTELRHVPDAVLVHPLAAERYSGPAHAEPLGGRRSLLTRPRSQRTSPAQRPLSRRPVRGFRLFHVGPQTRL